MMPRSREGTIDFKMSIAIQSTGLSPKGKRYMIRIPVRYKGKPLMPMKSNRVSKFIEEGKGRIRYDRKLKIHYLQLIIEPSDEKTQEITIGIDPGSSFDGVSVVSDDTHHINIELIQRSKKGKASIKAFKMRQASNRRVRRSRLRHRRIRFDNRTSNKMAPTIKANVDFRKWAIEKLTKIFPITRVVIEDVRFNHFKNCNGRSFSLVEQGKTELYRWIKDRGLKLELYNGWNTKKLRINTFGGDPKVSDKGSKSFEAHCIDSFVLACNKEHLIDDETGEILIDEPVAVNTLDVRKSVTFIEKIVKVRRCLTRTRKLYSSKGNTIGPQYYKKLKGGIKAPYRNISSHRNLCRVKPNDEHSNHPAQWDYIDNGFTERFKCNTAPYGGTVMRGVKKFFKEGEWQNRILSN